MKFLIIKPIKILKNFNYKYFNTKNIKMSILKKKIIPIKVIKYMLKTIYIKKISKNVFYRL